MTDIGNQVTGRSIKVMVFGNSVDEIELAALDKAREFFGDEGALEVVRDYGASPVSPGEPLAQQAAGKGWLATVTVREPARSADG